MKNILTSFLYAVVLFVSASSLMAQGVAILNGRQVEVERWIASQFGKGKTPPFSFEYGGQPSSKILSRCRHSLTRLPGTEDHQVRYLATYTDKSGLKVECEVTGWTDYSAVEWVLRFENTGTDVTPAISHVETADITFRHPAAAPVLYYANGSNATRADFAPHERSLLRGDTITMMPGGDRKSVV